MISVSGFREKDLRIWKMHKITNNSIKNRGSNLILKWVALSLKLRVFSNV